MIIIGLIILVILAFAYVALPLWAKIIVFGINSFFPDPIPVLDEVLMFASILNDILKIYKAMVIVEWIREHKTLLMRIGIGIVLFLIVFSLLRR